MAYIKSHELGYSIEKLIWRRLRSLKIPRPKEIAEELTPDIMREIPSTAFEAVGPWESGCLFFHGDVEEERVCDLQFEILLAHKNIDPKLPITLYLSSFGGDVFAGLALASTIQEVRRAARVVNIHIMGCAMSMGSIVAQVGDIRTMEPSSWFMIHNISSSVKGKTPDIKDEAEFCERLEDTAFAFYAQRSGKPLEFWKKLLHRRDVFISAQEALEYGLVDAISALPAYPRYRKRRTENQSTNA